MLGQALVRRLGQEGLQVLTLQRDVLDARAPDFAQVGKLVPQAVVNAIGLINRRMHLHESEFLRVNSLFPRRLADYCQSQSIPMVHVSTDCVFRGNAGPYDEYAPTLAQDTYGRTKLWGEPANALVLRTSIIGPEMSNFYSLLAWFLAQKGSVRGYVNHHWNGVTTWALAGAIAEILRNNQTNFAIRHVHGEDLNKYELLQMMARAYSRDTHVEPFEDAQGRDTRLRTRYPDFLGGLAIAPMEQQLVQLSQLSDADGSWGTLNLGAQ